MSEKSRLFQSAMDLFLRYGIKSVSMDDIARKMGISKKTIYNLVSNKKELIHAVVGAFIDEEVKVSEEIHKASTNAINEMMQIAKYVLRTLKYMKPTLTYDLQKYHPQIWKLIEDKHFSYLTRFVKENIQRGIDENIYRTEINADIHARMYIGIAKLLADPETFKDNNYNPSEIYESIIIYHLNGIINTAGKKELAKQLKLNK